MGPNRSTEAARLCASKIEATKQANELRKTLKPLMEKRRRARINESLQHLKTLILPLVGKDDFRYSKFEKADVLEMTVRFLKHLPSTPVNKSPADSYKEGYKTCLQRVTTVLSKTDLLDKDTCQRVSHYVQRSISAWEAPVCTNCKCSSPNSRAFPQTTTRAPNPTPEGAGKSRLRDGHPKTSTVPAVNRLSVVPQAIGSNVWRPW